MKYERFQQIVDTMNAAGYDYAKEIAEIEKRKTALAGKGKGEQNAAFSVQDHVRSMVYAQLSSRRPWDPIERNMSTIDRIFGNFNLSYLKSTESEYFVEELRKIHCGNQQIVKQMANLKHNVQMLEQIQTDYGSIEAYYLHTDLVTVVKSLSDSDGKYKLRYMGVPLVCEYLKGMGIEIVKPDSLIRRILGRLGYSRHIPATEWETIDICKKIGAEYGLSQTMVDTILWQYCAENRFELCTAKPKCRECGVTDCPYRTLI